MPLLRYFNLKALLQADEKYEKLFESEENPSEIGL